MRVVIGLFMAAILMNCGPEKLDAPVFDHAAQKNTEEEYGIAMLHNSGANGTWKAIASVKNGVPKALTESGPADLIEINGKIVRFIVEEDKKIVGTGVKAIEFSAGNLHSKLVGKMQYRRATIYLFLQKSVGGHRLLAYGSSLIKHHGQSVGTSLDSVGIKEIKEHIASEKISLPDDTRLFTGTNR